MIVIDREKVTVYITFIHNVACFCVQREDSPIDEMSEELMKLAKVSTIQNQQGFQSGPVPSTFTRLRSCIVPAEITEPSKISGGQNHKYDGRLACGIFFIKN